MSEIRSFIPTPKRVGLKFILPLAVLGVVIFLIAIFGPGSWFGFKAAVEVFLFWLAWIGIPGAVLVSILGFRGDKIEYLAFSLGLGMAFYLISWYCLSALGILAGLRFYWIVPVLIFGILIAKGSASFGTVKMGWPECLLVALGFCGALAYAKLGLAGINPWPVGSSHQTFNQDLLWHIGNAGSVYRQFPPTDARVLGLPIRYHLLDAIIDGGPSYLFNIHPAITVFRYGWVFKMIFLVSSAYAFGKAFLGSAILGGLSGLIFLFTTSADDSMMYAKRMSPFLNNLTIHLFARPFGIEIALPLLLLAATALLTSLKQEASRDWLRPSLMAGLLGGAATGGKGPFGLCLAGVAFVGGFLLMLIDRVRGQAMLRNTLPVGLFSVVVYALLIAGGGAAKLGLDPSYTVLKMPFFDQREAFGLPSALVPILIPLAAFLYLPFAVPPFFIALAHRLRYFAKTTDREMILYGMAILGFGAGFLVSHSGNSQIYFMMMATPFIEIVALEFWWESRSKAIPVLVAVVLLSIGTWGMYQQVLGFEVYARRIERDVRSAPVKLPSLDSVTGDENAALLWIASHTSPKAVVATNKIHQYLPLSAVSARSFYVSAISCRQIFLEGYAYAGNTPAALGQIDRLQYENERLFSGGLEADGAAALGIDYVLVLQRLPATLAGGFKLIYSNPGAQVYATSETNASKEY